MTPFPVPRRVPADHPLRITVALRNPQTASAAVAELAGTEDPICVDGLAEMVCLHPNRQFSSWTVAAAIKTLAAIRLPQAQGVIKDTLLAALSSDQANIRAAALRGLLQRRLAVGTDEVTWILANDPAHSVRQLAVRVLATNPEVDPQTRPWQVLTAADDPHWRVRFALIETLLEWGLSSSDQPHIDGRLAQLQEDTPEPIRRHRIAGLRAYLQYRWTGELVLQQETSLRQPTPWDDPDSAVLARRLKQLGETGRTQQLEQLLSLTGDDDQRVRELVVRTLTHEGNPLQWAEVLRALDDPRHPATNDLQEALSGLDWDRLEEIARVVLQQQDSSPGPLSWAVEELARQQEAGFTWDDLQERISDLFHQQAASWRVRHALVQLATGWPKSDPEDEEDEATVYLRRCVFGGDWIVQKAALAGLQQRETLTAEVLDELLLAPAGMPSAPAAVRAEAARLLASHRWGDPNQLRRLAEDADGRVRLAVTEGLAEGHPQDRPLQQDALVGDRLQQDPHPLVRAAALTPERAHRLVEDPTSETSWHVLERAARLVKTSLWNLEPDPPWRASAKPERLSELRPMLADPPSVRRLGGAGPLVAPLSVSGHYQLPAEGFVQAVEAGVNLLFWEPSYDTLTKFAGRLSSTDRRRLHFLTGTFEADTAGIVRDVQGALKRLQVERISVFLIFWVRSWDRITDQIRQTLSSLQESGQIGQFGLSTHNRQLAIEAIRQGWDPVMVRHNAAHRGAEQEVFPVASHHGTGLITFNSTCYGRMLQPPRTAIGRQLEEQSIQPAPITAADCYRYSFAHPAVTTVFTAPVTVEQLTENLAALHHPQLAEDRREALLMRGRFVYEENTVFRQTLRSR